MDIKGKVHCLFEQSGIFKNEFRRLGINAEDYDIQNNFGETDHVIDLFTEIDNAFENKSCVFDQITKNDLIMAFFPCIHFCELSCLNMRYDTYTKKGTSIRDSFGYVMEKNRERAYFFELLNKLFCVCMERGLRMIFENPYGGGTYLRTSFPKPQVIDSNRMLRGDHFVKPTGFWFVNCENTDGFTMQYDKVQKIVHANTKGYVESARKKGLALMRSSKRSGICSEERSMISPDYARNFICDFILGKGQPEIDPQLF